MPEKTGLIPRESTCVCVGVYWCVCIIYVCRLFMYYIICWTLRWEMPPGRNQEAKPHGWSRCCINEQQAATNMRATHICIYRLHGVCQTSRCNDRDSFPAFLVCLQRICSSCIARLEEERRDKVAFLFFHSQSFTAHLYVVHCPHTNLCIALCSVATSFLFFGLAWFAFGPKKPNNNNNWASCL